MYPLDGTFYGKRMTFQSVNLQIYILKALLGEQMRDPMCAKPKEAGIYPSLFPVQLQSLKFEVSFCSFQTHVFACSMIKFLQCSSGQL